MLMDQYVQLRNGSPITIVRMVSRVNGPAPADIVGQEQLALEMIGAPEENIEPALTKN
ncbi:MAG: hypothetical protein IPH53_18510 [Flavobacteriales bacterium]|nr:hypothetical protein [Flavobacteriales bacterium]